MQTRADEQIAQRLEPVMKEGQSLERTIQENVGQSQRSDLKFESANVVIVKKGEEITSSLLSKVQKIVKERLEDMKVNSKNSYSVKFNRLI